MTPESLGQDRSLDPESPGQRWEYLVLLCNGKDVGRFLGARQSGKGFFSGDEDSDPVVADYNKKLRESKTISERKSGGLAEALKIVGNEGWELITSIQTESLLEKRQNLLIFKRPALS